MSPSAASSTGSGSTGETAHEPANIPSTDPVDTGQAETPSADGDTGAFARRSLAGKSALWVGLTVAQFVLVGGFGLVFLHLLRPVAQDENAVNRWFVQQRTDLGNTVSDWLSHAADTGAIVAYVVLAGLILRWVLHRWLESLVVALTVSTQAAVFLACTVLVKRTRPPVPKLDVSPPTSSYPSGHVGAATAFAASLALVLAWHQRHRLAQWAAWLILLFPAAVAWSRLYRGMHHLSDVLAGVADGFLALTVSLVVLIGGLHRHSGGTTRHAAKHGAT